MRYDMTRPCSNCPFRSDKRFPLARGRVVEIINGGSFPCHKTTTAGGADGQDEVACAGLLILLEKENVPNQMMRIAERVGMYDRRKLEMDAPVYDSIGQAILKIEGYQ